MLIVSTYYFQFFSFQTLLSPIYHMKLPSAVCNLCSSCFTVNIEHNRTNLGMYRTDKTMKSVLLRKLWDVETWYLLLVAFCRQWSLFCWTKLYLTRRQHNGVWLTYSFKINIYISYFVPWYFYKISYMFDAEWYFCFNMNVHKSFLSCAIHSLILIINDWK